MTSIIFPGGRNSGFVSGFEKLPKSLRSNLSHETLADLSKFPADWPELELLPFAATPAPPGDSGNYAAFLVAVVAPTSRGNVTINSTDTNDNPLVNTNWLSTRTDQELLVQGFRRAREVAAATGIVIGEDFWPGPSTQSDAQILRLLKGSAGGFAHASSTCRYLINNYLYGRLFKTVWRIHTPCSLG